MKPSVRLFRFASGLILASGLGTAQIASSDFSSSTNWSSPAVLEGNGSFTFSSGVLGFTVDSPAGSGTYDTIFTQWLSGTASPTSSWTATIYAHLDSMVLSGTQSINLNFIVATTAELPGGSNGSNIDQCDIALDRYTNGVSSFSGVETSFNAYVGGENFRPSSTYFNSGATDVTLRFDYDHLTGVLATSFDSDGSGAALPTQVESYNLLSGETSWGLTEGDTFSFLLVGSAQDLIVNPGIATFDNFLVVETSAVPEPATTALWLGAVVLAVVIARRRLRRSG